ncbi:MAG: 5'-nucleotidase C-terminal domain-containing protein [Roseiflexaceae bacterium]|nr:5'-nucleotidase C-terminal domain-containing protein [Roseiflexaceae bacterium]
MVKMSRRTFLRNIAVGTGTLVFAYTGLTVEAAGPEAYQLRIFHTNDHHARIEPVTGGTPVAPIHAGVSRRKTLLDGLRRDASKQNVLLLDAGDVFQGTLFFTQYRGLADLEFYNALEYDAVAIGNHEFDIGQQPLADFISRAKFPVLSANIKTDRSSPLYGKITPWYVKWVGGQPIGIIGVTTEDTETLSNPGPGITFTPAIDAVKLGVADLRSRGVNKIIVLSHLGITVDRDLGKRVDGVAAIIGGHSHTPMGAMLPKPTSAQPYPEVVPSPSGKPVIIATDWEWGRWLGDLTLGFDSNGDITSVVAGQPTEVAASITPDPGYENRIAVFSAPINALRKQKIGDTSVLLNGARTDVRSKETNLGNFVADSTLAKTKAAGTTLAIVNGGGVRTSIAAGPITLGNVLEVLPFGNTMVVMTITGAQVREALENGVSQVEAGAGRFPQVGGMRYTFEPKAAVGSRIGSVDVKDGSGYKPLDPAASYKIVVNNFIAAGGDGYSVLTKGTGKVDTGFLDNDTLSEYISANSPVNAAVEGRITVK